VLGAAAHELDSLPLAKRAFLDAHINHHTLVGVEVAVVHEGLERDGGVAGRRRDTVDDGLDDVIDPKTRLAAGAKDLLGLDAKGAIDLGADIVGPGDGHVDLVQDRDDGEVVLDGEVGVGDGLRLDALGGIDKEDGPLAGGEAAADLVAEIDVPWGIDEIQLVPVALVVVEDRDGMHADRDAALPLEVHGIEHLVAEVAFADGSGLEEELVAECALAMIDVGDDGEIADELRVGHGRVSAPPRGSGPGPIRAATA
jgi:hypothetical protein